MILSFCRNLSICKYKLPFHHSPYYILISLELIEVFTTFIALHSWFLIYGQYSSRPNLTHQKTIKELYHFLTSEDG